MRRVHKLRKHDLGALLAPEQLRALRTGSPQEKVNLFTSLTQDRQDQVLENMGQGMRMQLFAAAPADLRRRIQSANGPQSMVAQDLAEAKLLRAVYSDRQLEEVLADFWYNHFNVFLEKGADRYLVTAYERDAIRPHVLGKFEDLLRATAQSPAMLFYLDNWQSTGGQSPAGRRQQHGLNENYGRELLELHTLGVDGGYTQKDVTEVARCFTGWTIRQPQRLAEFEFNARMHDNGEKAVLGVRILAGGGMDDGFKVLHLLAHHPSTARFISRKLAMRFVADDPPETLVDRMAATFLKRDGDLRAVLKTMFESPEFWSRGAYRSKLKSPLEMVASSLRAVNADVDFAFGLNNQLAQLGEPLYRKAEPTGYSNSGQEWLNSAGLLARMNFSVALANNKVPGVKVDSVQPAEGVTLGSPEFQRNETGNEMNTRRFFLRNSALAMVGAGTVPLWLERALYAADAPSPRKKILVAIFQRGAADGLNIVVPHAENRYYELRPTIAVPRPSQASDRRRTQPSTWMASLACIPRWLRSSQSGTTDIWPSYTRQGHPIRRARTSTRRTSWNRRLRV